MFSYEAFLFEIMLTTVQSFSKIHAATTRRYHFDSWLFTLKALWLITALKQQLMLFPLDSYSDERPEQPEPNKQADDDDDYKCKESILKKRKVVTCRKLVRKLHFSSSLFTLEFAKVKLRRGGTPSSRKNLQKTPDSSKESPPFQNINDEKIASKWLWCPLVYIQLQPPSVAIWT